MAESCAVAIVGAGAAGLAAGIFAAETSPGSRTVLLDGAPRLGAKILIAGGGRCNVTHEAVRPEDFHGSRTFVKHVLAAFDAGAAARWFESLGVPLKREATGKLFPASDRARDVLDALVRRCGELGVEIRTSSKVASVAVEDDGFRIDGTLRARRVILAAGGRSVPATGSDGSGYALARALGHTVTPTFPALVPLLLADGFFHASLSGVSHEVELTVRAEGRVAERRVGSLLWTHFGVSGPVVLDASRAWIETPGATLHASMFPGEPFEGVERWLVGERRTLANALADRLPARVAEALARHVRIDPGERAARLAREDRRRLVHALTALELPVVGDRGWNHAEVTAGGVPLAEVDFRTLRSKATPGLHLAGEILDCDGRIGGFNFQWAWATGHLAGRAAARAGEDRR
ncbi:MAG TPA: NAD(P)/FAD-dependent oxidoreductase [Candidatus Polarisedimenticolaceae bacterium]